MMRDEAVRVRQGANAMTPPGVLLALATDPSVTVRASVAMNPALPARAVEILSADTDGRVRTLLGRGPAKETRLRARQDAVASLTAMIAEAGLRVRTHIAQTVHDMPDGPREIVLRLAYDPAPEVCEPVIRLSPLLTQQDLLDLLGAIATPCTVLAVANRPGIDEAVCDAIVGSAGPEAITALLVNRTAGIRDATLEMLAAQAEEQTAWQGPLIARPNLPIRAQRLLAEIITGDLRAQLADRMDPSGRRIPVASSGGGTVSHPARAKPASSRTWSPRRL